MAVSSYRELKVWQIAMQVTKEVYTLTDTLPSAERYGLASQMQRAAVSIASNIAEGQQRRSAREFCQFLSIARGSAAELATQLIILGEIYNQPVEQLYNKVEEIQKMTYALLIRLESTRR